MFPLSNPFVEQSADAVRAAARAFTARDPKTHWSVLAALLGSVEDRQLFSAWSFRSTRAWAESDLDVSSAEVLELLRFYRLIQASGHPLEEWAQVSKGKARVVARALHLGGDPAKWLQVALSSETEQALRDLLKRQLGEETWLSYTIEIPDSLEPLGRAAMRKALAVAVDEELPAEPEAQDAMAIRRENHFRCLEVLCAAFLT